MIEHQIARMERAGLGLKQRLVLGPDLREERQRRIGLPRQAQRLGMGIAHDTQAAACLMIGRIEAQGLARSRLRAVQHRQRLGRTFQFGQRHAQAPRRHAFRAGQIGVRGIKSAQRPQFSERGAIERQRLGRLVLIIERLRLAGHEAVAIKAVVPARAGRDQRQRGVGQLRLLGKAALPAAQFRQHGRPAAREHLVRRQRSNQRISLFGQCLCRRDVGLHERGQPHPLEQHPRPQLPRAG